MKSTKKANKDAYERAKQAEQDALAAQDALTKTSMQAQTDMDATKKANKDAYEWAKQAEQNALAARAAQVKTSMQAQTDTWRQRRKPTKMLMKEPSKLNKMHLPLELL